MEIKCVWEHNGNDTLLYAVDCIGAFTRGESKETALRKMPCEIKSYLKWCNKSVPKIITFQIIQENESKLNISDADTEVIFDIEKMRILPDEYTYLKSLVLKSSEDFLKLYNSVPDKDKSCLLPRKTFYGLTPVTAREMYEHTKNVNSYYFGEICVSADNNETIVDCRKRGFEVLESNKNFLNNNVYNGSYGEQWSLRKLLRRFLWHDRIHAKAMYKMAIKTFGENNIENVFSFNIK